MTSRTSAAADGTPVPGSSPAAAPAARGIPRPAAPAGAGPRAAPGATGTVAAGFEPVRAAFEGVLAAQGGAGAAIAAWHDGAWLVDLWGGGWDRDSIAMPYSVSKPFAAVCALLLAERGQLELDAAVARYWREFTAPATVRQVLSHQAGLVALARPLPTEALFDWDLLCAELAAAEPLWAPGTAHGESALLYGHLVGEIVRRVDGRGIGRFLREEVCGPLGLDFAFGLSPAEAARAVDLVGLTPEFRERAAAGRPALYRAAMGNPPGIQDGAVVNSARLRAAEIPSTNGHGTARAVAGLYAALLAGDLLGPGLLAEAGSAQCSGPDRVMGGLNAWGLGFGVDKDGFGMGGLGGSMGWASRAGRYAYGFVTASMGDHARSDAVENALRDCLGMPPLRG